MEGLLDPPPYLEEAVRLVQPAILVGAAAVTCHAAYHSHSTTRKALVPVMHRCVLWLSVSNVIWAISNLM